VYKLLCTMSYLGVTDGLSVLDHTGKLPLHERCIILLMLLSKCIRVSLQRSHRMTLRTQGPPEERCALVARLSQPISTKRQDIRAAQLDVGTGTRMAQPAVAVIAPGG
jgi:hypothetical protein